MESNRNVSTILNGLVNPYMDYNLLALYLAKNSKNDSVLIEKFHSLSNWLNIFHKGYIESKEIKVNNSTVDNDTIKLISFIDMVKVYMMYYMD